MIAVLFSVQKVLLEKIPKEGVIYLSQNLNFLKSVKIKDTITDISTVKEVCVA